MNSPYNGKFQVTQEFKGADHDGLDLVGLDSKEIHSTVNGEVVYAAWENSKNHKQGFGQYVVVKNGKRYYHFGHLSKILVTLGQKVKTGDVIGIEGDTGYSFGSHCHYCVRTSMARGTYLDVCEISGIPNKLGIYDDGAAASKETTTEAPKETTSEKKEITDKAIKPKIGPNIYHNIESSSFNFISVKSISLVNIKNSSSKRFSSRNTFTFICKS